MRITRCETAHFRLPREVWWPVALEDRTLAIESIELITCEIETDTGVRGGGYTYTLGRGGAGVHGLLSEAASMLVGQQLRTASGIWERLDRSFQRVGHAGVVSLALAAADIALWDALAVEAGVPLYRLIGAERESVPAYGSSIDLGYSRDKLVATVREHVERGLEAVKVKVGRAVGEDLERLAAVRAAIGSDRRLMVDANLGWSLADAARRARLMEEFDLTWLEEPLHPEDVDGHVRLQGGTSIAIALGETLFSIDEFRRYIEAGAVRYVQADAARLGGITPFLRVAELAHAAHLTLAPHFVQDVHVHLLCAVPNGEILEHLPLLDAVLEHPLPIAADGTVSPPDRPGTGVSFRRDLLAPHRVARSELRA
ncbi:MAG TPA: mandelate racemase/muconate lactonizing enzyme family protein [Gaiellales bacterium]